MAAPRSAKEVIDQAIRDNRPWEYLCYGLVLLFALLGASVIITGLVMGNIALAVVGAATSYLLWPALSNARVIRRENLLLRLFEAPLSRASTARGAAEALRDLLVHVFTNRTG